MIQISIQEDPWNLPSSIRTLVDNIQRYVEGQWVERVSHMSVAFGSEYRLWCCLERASLCVPVFMSREEQSSRVIS